jgi:hypothetical protein
MVDIIFLLKKNEQFHDVLDCFITALESLSVADDQGRSQIPTPPTQGEFP